MSSSVIKYARRQDSGWKQAAGCSGETSINLSTEIFEFLSYGMIDGGEETSITFKLFHQDFIDALAFIESQLPLFRSTSHSSEKVLVNNPIINILRRSIDSFFGGEPTADYTVILYCRRDGRYYLKGLKQSGFTIRDFLVEFSSAIKFEMIPEGFSLRLISAISENDTL